MGILIRKKKFDRRFFGQLGMTLAGLAVVIGLAWPLFKNWHRQRTVNQEIAELEKEIANLESRNGTLRSLIGYLETDEFVEEQARKNLNFKKEGEQVVVVKEIQENGRLSDGQPEKGPEGSREDAEKSNPVRWWRYFIGSHDGA